MFDVAVSPSEWGEGFSNTIAEAMSRALPVIATDVGDSTVLIGNAGLIIPPSNSTDLAEALCEIYNKPLAARSVMGMNARERIVARFELKRMATTFQDVMTRIGGRLDRSNH
jgi:glycosyltransferase involved in cell wall biosynthesis